MKLLIEGNTIEFEPKSGTELYEIVMRTMTDPKYKIVYDISFSEFSASSEKQNYYPIEADLLLRRIENISQMDKPITAEQCEKLLAVMSCGINSNIGKCILGAMVFYDKPNNL